MEEFNGYNLGKVDIKKEYTVEEIKELKLPTRNEFFEMTSPNLDKDSEELVHQKVGLIARQDEFDFIMEQEGVVFIFRTTKGGIVKDDTISSPLGEVEVNELKLELIPFKIKEVA